MAWACLRARVDRASARRGTLGATRTRPGSRQRPAAGSQSRVIPDSRRPRKDRKGTAQQPRASGARLLPLPHRPQGPRSAPRGCCLPPPPPPPPTPPLLSVPRRTPPWPVCAQALPPRAGPVEPGSAAASCATFPAAAAAAAGTTTASAVASLPCRRPRYRIVCTPRPARWTGRSEGCTACGHGGGTHLQEPHLTIAEARHPRSQVEPRQVLPVLVPLGADATRERLGDRLSVAGSTVAGAAIAVRCVGSP